MDTVNVGLSDACVSLYTRYTRVKLLPDERGGPPGVCGLWRLLCLRSDDPKSRLDSLDWEIPCGRGIWEIVVSSKAAWLGSVGKARVPIAMADKRPPSLPELCVCCALIVVGRRECGRGVECF